MPHGWSSNGIDGLCEMFPSLRADLCLIALTILERALTSIAQAGISCRSGMVPGTRALIESVRLAERLTKEWLFRRDGASRATCTTAPSNRASDWSSVWKRCAAGFAGPSSRGI